MFRQALVALHRGTQNWPNRMRGIRRLTLLCTVLSGPLGQMEQIYTVSRGRGHAYGAYLPLSTSLHISFIEYAGAFKLKH